MCREALCSDIPAIQYLEVARGRSVLLQRAHQLRSRAPTELPAPPAAKHRDRIEQAPQRTGRPPFGPLDRPQHENMAQRAECRLDINVAKIREDGDDQPGNVL